VTSKPTELFVFLYSLLSLLQTFHFRLNRKTAKWAIRQSCRLAKVWRSL